MPIGSSRQQRAKELRQYYETMQSQNIDLLHRPDSIGKKKHSINYCRQMIIGEILISVSFLFSISKLVIGYCLRKFRFLSGLAMFFF